MNELGKRIKELRVEAGLTQQALAQKLGVLQHTISSYEHNIKRPSLETLILMADIFNTSTDYLLGRVDF